ncbi:MAG TPA: hypothetical protein VG408_10945, partial [Actinomycetota bacterium]|nr:hypothetical protein [Actinomycetota bacterium]
MSMPPDSIAEEDSGAPTPRSFPRGRMLLSRGSKLLGLGLLTLVAYVLVRGLMDPYDSISLDPGFWVASGLVGAGVLLLRGQEGIEDEVVSVARAPRPRSPLGVLTLSVLFLVVGVAILLQNLGVAEVGVGQITAVSLFVIGCGLLVGAWWGRSRFLMVVGILLIPLVIVT